MDLIKKVIQNIKEPDIKIYEAAKERLRHQARPAGSLGILEDVGARLASIFKTLDVQLINKIIVTCAGDHGICAEGVSLFPSDVTHQMVYNFVAGGAGINALARQAGAEVVVVDMGCATDLSDLAREDKIITKKKRIK